MFVFLYKIELLVAKIIIAVFQFFLFKRINANKVNKILVFRTGSIGDSVCAIPAINNLRNHFRSAEIHLLTKTGGSNLVGLNALIEPKLIDSIVDYDITNLNVFYKTIKSNLYDIIIELPQVNSPFYRQIRNMLFFRFCGIKAGFGWSIGLGKFLRKHKEKYMTIEREPIRLLNIMRKNGIIIESEDYLLNITIQDIKKVDQLLESLHLVQSNRNVGIVVGAKREQNRWPIESFQKVINYLLEKQYNCFLIGGKEDGEIAKKLIPHNQLFDFTGKTTPIESAVLFSKCAFVLSNDTGPMHLAYAVGTFVFAIFSSRDYSRIWYPPNELSIVFRNSNIHCRVCLSEVCSNNICMQEIQPKDIIKELEIYLKQLNDNV